MMDSYTPLQNALIHSYSENSFQIKASTKMVNDLFHGCLNLSDSEIGDEEIYFLCAFLENRVALMGVKTLFLNKKSDDGIPSHRICFIHKSPSPTAFELFDYKLMRTVLRFIARSTALHSLIIDSIPVKSHVVDGLATALSLTTSVIRWMSVKNCNLGDAGLRVLAPQLSKMPLQVLVLDKCRIGDNSTGCICSIIKAQESVLDSMLFNYSLRGQTDELTIDTADRNRIRSTGMSTLSLNKNLFTSKSLILIGQTLQKNNWLLGLALADNRLDEMSVSIALDAVSELQLPMPEKITEDSRLCSAHRGLQNLTTILLHGNPGYSPAVRRRERRIRKLQGQSIPLMLVNRRDHIQGLTMGVTMLLERWLQLQQQRYTAVEFDNSSTVGSSSAYSTILSRKSGQAASAHSSPRKMLEIDLDLNSDNIESRRNSHHNEIEKLALRKHKSKNKIARKAKIIQDDVKTFSNVSELTKRGQKQTRSSSQDSQTELSLSYTHSKTGSNLMNDQQFGLNYFIDAARDLSSIATEVRELCGLVHQAVGSLKLKYGAQSRSSPSQGNESLVFSTEKEASPLFLKTNQGNEIAVDSSPSQYSKFSNANNGARLTNAADDNSNLTIIEDLCDEELTDAIKRSLRRKLHVIMSDGEMIPADFSQISESPNYEFY